MDNIECQEFSIRKFKLNVLLDLDNTIINSLKIPEELELVPIEYKNKFKYYDMEKEYRVFERPYLQMFLDYLFLNFNVSVFTAADKEYGMFIYENIIKRPERKINYLFSGYHSSLSEIYYGSPKDLRLLWDEFKVHDFTPCNTVILDDLDEVYNNNLYNCIRAPMFEILTQDNKVNYNAINDNFLLNDAIKRIENFNTKMLTKPCLTHISNKSSNFKCKLI